MTSLHSRHRIRRRAKPVDACPCRSAILHAIRQPRIRRQVLFGPLRTSDRSPGHRHVDGLVSRREASRRHPGSDGRG
jgi:hypothetical protein